MALEAPNSEPREFVYIDEESINGHLSSMGVGVETGARRESDSEQERRGRLRAVLPLFAGVADGEVEQRNLDSKHFGRQINLTAPYRFGRLIEEFHSGDIEIKNPLESGVGFGDVVKLEGTVEPMSLFRVELHDEAFASFGKAFTDAAEKLSDSPDAESNLIEQVSRTGMKAKGNEATALMAKILYADRVPLRLDTGDQSFAIPVRRESCRTTLQYAFSSPRTYTILGRIEGRVGSTESWVPGEMFRTLQSLSLGDPEETFAGAIQEIADGRDIELEDRHMEIEGPAKIVHPIGIWW